MIRLFLLQPAVVFRARVNMPGTLTYPLDELIYDGVTAGSSGAIFQDMTLLLGTAAGLDDLGRQRMRKVATSTVLPVGRSGRGRHDGELDVLDDAFITVLDDYRVWAKIPYIDAATGESFKDSDIAGVEAEFPRPVANGGIGYAGTIDASLGVATVQFDAGESFQFDTASSSHISGVSSYLWKVDDGTVTAGSTTSAAITVTFPPGFRWVHLTATGSNSRFHECHIPVFTRDANADQSITAFAISNHHVGMGGQEIDIKVLADIPRSQYPDGTLGMIWDDELESSSPVRPHMEFIGWHQSDEVGISHLRTGTLRDTTLHLVDVAGRLKSLPGFGQVLEYSATPDTWVETSHANLIYYLVYLLHWHSTALDLADLLPMSAIITGFEFVSIGSDADTLYNQVNHIANMMAPDHAFNCNRRGQLLLVDDPMLMHIADRPPAIVVSLEESEWTEVSYSYTRPPRVNRLQRIAILSSSTLAVAVACIAPGLGRGQGSEDLEVPDGLVATQFTLNYVEGNRYARLNAPYGLFTIRTPLALLTNGLSPAAMGWVQLTVNGQIDPQRGLAFVNQRGLLLDMSISYELTRTGLARTATLTWEVETDGPPAQTVVIEAEESA